MRLAALRAVLTILALSAVDNPRSLRSNRRPRLVAFPYLLF